MYAKIKRVSKSLKRLFFTFLIIILLSFIPAIYDYEYKYNRIVDMKFNPSNYTISIGDYLKQLASGDFGSYTKDSNRYGRMGGENDIPQRSISEDIFYYYKTTLSIFIPGLLLGLFFGVSFAFLTLLLKQRWKRVFEFLSFIIIAIPDFFVIIMLQFLVITIFKKTGIRIFAIATGGSSTAVFLPIFTLSLFPFAYIYRVTINSFEEILSNRYIQTAYSKGLTRFKILFSHVTKNGLVVTLKNLPSIVMPSISNLFIIEYLYNTHGITDLVFSHSNNLHVLVFSVFLVWFMVEGILLLNDLILKTLTKHRGEENYA